MRQHVVGDLDARGGGLGLLPGLGDDDSDVIADIADFAERQDRMRPGLHRRTVFRMDHPAADEAADLVLGDVFAGKYGDHPVFGRPLRDVYLLDRGMCMRAAHEISIDLALEIDVIGIAPLAGDEAVVFLALYAGADSCLAHDIPPVISVAPTCSGRRPGWPSLYC